MNKFFIATATAGLLAAFGLTQAGAAAAVTAESGSAAEVVAKLEAQGHHVQLNGSSNVPLSLCKATGVHGLRNSNIDASGTRIDEELFNTVYVDVVCQDG
jgi:hypothetical protein